MEYVTTAPHRLASLVHSITASTVQLHPDPIDPKTVISPLSTEDSVHRNLPFEYQFGTLGTGSHYLALSRENSENPTVLTFVSPNPANKGLTQAGAGAIPETSIILQRWDGLVLECGETEFTCHLYEGDEDFPLKSATIDLEEFSPEDRQSIEPGAPFVWTIGYRVRHKTRIRFSEFYFRKMLAWTKEEIDLGAKAGEALSEDAGWFQS
jgi:hypothetical protein